MERELSYRSLPKWILLALVSATTAWGIDIFPTLINGRVADPSLFPASVWTRSCTATVVGERVVFIAAHCVSGSISFTVGANRYTASCNVAREYSGNSTADYALCKTDKVVTGIPYEKVNIDPARFKVGEPLLLTGYGCVRAGGGGGNDGTYRIGESTIRRMPSGSSNDIVTSGGAALCFGDSGGPAFHVAPDGDRYVVSTNSRGDIRTTSYLSATHTATARRFFDAWYQMAGMKICGIHSDAVGCRGTAPQQPTNFSIAHPLVQLEGKVTAGNESRLPDIKRWLEDALNAMP